MKYTVSINEAKRSITVTLADGTKGVAKCCTTDHFDINTGIELALERAKVAKASAEKIKESKMNNSASSVMELIKALEKALPKGRMVIVGNGNEMTATQKRWLHSLTDCEGNYDKGYDDGYNDGYADAQDEYEECEDCERYSDAMHRIVAILD
jgi:hypothetical protein